jgi:hypothetical protein
MSDYPLNHRLLLLLLGNAGWRSLKISEKKVEGVCLNILRFQNIPSLSMYVYVSAILAPTFHLASVRIIYTMYIWTLLL